METVKPSPAPSPPTSKSLTKDLQQNRIERLQSARNIAKQILSRYPDYGKTEVAYVAAIVETIALFAPDIQRGLANLRTGITSRANYVPTSADLIKMGQELEAAKAQAETTTAQIQHVVLKGTPAWDAWQKRRGSTPCVPIRKDDLVVGDGWYFPTEYPPCDFISPSSSKHINQMKGRQNGNS
jgi:hypothetical protein